MRSYQTGNSIDLYKNELQIYKSIKQNLYLQYLLIIYSKFQKSIKNQLNLIKIQLFNPMPKKQKNYGIPYVIKTNKCIIDEVLCMKLNKTIINTINENKFNYFNAFVYKDHITNNILPVRYKDQANMEYKQNFDENNQSNTDNNYVQYRKRQQYGQSFYHKNRSLDNISPLTLIKETKKFHIESIKNKNYKIKNLKYNLLNQKQRNQQIYSKYILKKNERYQKEKQLQKSRYLQQKRQLSRILSSNLSYQCSRAQISINATQKQIQQGNYSHIIQDQHHWKQQKNNQIKTTSNSQQKSFVQNQSQHNILQHKNTAKTFFKLKDYKKKLFTKRKERQKFGQISQMINNSSKQNKQNLDSVSKQQKEFIKDLNQELKFQINKDNQYLITPNLNRLKIIDKSKGKKKGRKSISNSINKFDNHTGNLHQRLKNMSKIYSQSHEQKKAQKIQKQPFIISNDLITYQFDIQNLSKIAQKYKNSPNQQLKLCKQQNIQQEYLIQLIKQGNYFKTQIQLSLNPQLLHTKQKKTKNNLLHLCIINNKTQIFLMIFSKCQENQINLLLQANKYNKTPMELLKNFKIFYEICSKNKQFRKIIYKKLKEV